MNSGGLPQWPIATSITKPPSKRFFAIAAFPYVAVDEAKKALFANAQLKSFDFVVYSKNGPNLLVDVKGRKCRNRTDPVDLKPGPPNRT